jgi:uncharacterized protein
VAGVTPARASRRDRLVSRGLATRALGTCALLLVLATGVSSQELPPELTQPINDFANVIDQQSRQQIDDLIRGLQRASGDVVIVATVPTFQPYADIRDYAIRMFENRGRGIGEKGKDNGLLVVLAVDDRRVWIEVGYDLEQFITDGFAGETSRQYMIPEFRGGGYGPGLLIGVRRIVGRIAQGRNVTIEGAPPPTARPPSNPISGGSSIILALFVLFLIINGLSGGGGGRGRRRGWHSGVGPFGGGLGGGLGGFGGGGFGGGGFGGGFGGFGGGRSGGGGGGGSW